MDPLCISPSWVEHSTRMLPGLAWVPFIAEDNKAKEDDEFVLVTYTNLKRLLQMPYAICVSLLAFDPDLARFCDSFLMNRERLSANQSLAKLDIAVFSLFYRFVADTPPGLKFSSGAKTTSLLGLQVLSSTRILQLIALFHQPRFMSTTSNGDSDNDTLSPVRDLINRWILMNPQFDREFGRMLEAWSLSKSVCTSRNAAALRGLQELLSLNGRRRILPSLAGVRGSMRDAIQFISYWYSSSAGVAERGHLLVFVAFGLEALEEKQMEEFFQLVLNEDDELASSDQTMLKDVVTNVQWFRGRFVDACTKHLRMDETRVEYLVGIMQSFPSSEVVGDPNAEETSIIYIEEDGASKRHGEEEEEQHPSDPVSQLKEIAPHLGRYFCERLLEASGWDLNRAIASVMEGTLPEQVLHLDFAAETAPNTTTVSNVAASSSKPVFRDNRTADDLLKERVDSQVKAQIASLYDEYDDEYDDALDDGGGRLAVDTGAQNLDEDDPQDRYAGGEEGGEDGRGAESVAPFARRAAASQPSKQHDSVSGRQKRTQPDSHLQPRQTFGTSGTSKRSGSAAQSSTASTVRKQPPGPRDMIAPVSREASVVDVDGVRRNAQGQTVEEDELMRPNMNRAVAPPPDTDRRKTGRAPQQPRILTPEEEAQRLKRERERKESRGNVVRQRGADRKQAKSGF